MAHITSFMAFLSVTGYAVNTAKAYVMVIGFHCKIKAYQDIAQNFLVTNQPTHLSKSDSKFASSTYKRV